MDRFVIRGGQRLEGRIRVSGAKNAVLPILAASLLTDQECIIRDVPRLKDVAVMFQILRRLGAQVNLGADGAETVIRVRARDLTSAEVPEVLVRQMRSSVFLMGPLLGRLGRVRLSYPGGCAIGPRPIDLHLQGLQALGAVITERSGYIEAEAANLCGTPVHLDQPSVGATENVIMAATLARGTTMITNAAREPEIVDLASFLNSMGARISGAGTDVVRVEGVGRLKGSDYRVIPDRIEAGTFLVAATITGGDVVLDNVIPEHLKSPLAKLREVGAVITVGPASVRVMGPDRPAAVDLKTMPYPGFPTDLQSQFMALLAVSDGTSVVAETIFENRFKVAAELRRMGAQIAVDGRVAVVRGVPRLSGTVVEAMDDLRGGAALVVAGLAARGETIVDGIRHIERGYEVMDKKLRHLGARIWHPRPAGSLSPRAWPVAR